VQIDDHVSDAAARAVELGLLAFNEQRLGPANELPVRLVVRAPDGSVVGGLLGHTRWSWLYVAKPWVAEAERGENAPTASLRYARGISAWVPAVLPDQAALTDYNFRHVGRKSHVTWRTKYPTSSPYASFGSSAEK